MGPVTGPTRTRTAVTTPDDGTNSAWPVLTSPWVQVQAVLPWAGQSSVNGESGAPLAQVRVLLGA